MKNVLLVRSETKRGLYKYKVVDESGQVLYKSSETGRNYVAMYLYSHVNQKTGKAKVNVLWRFGRYDLIGKGESRHLQWYIDRNPDETFYYADINHKFQIPQS